MEEKNLFVDPAGFTNDLLPYPYGWLLPSGGLLISCKKLVCGPDKVWRKPPDNQYFDCKESTPKP